MGGAGAPFPSSISMHEMEIENANKSSTFFSSAAARVPFQVAPPWPGQEGAGPGSCVGMWGGGEESAEPPMNPDRG